VSGTYRLDQAEQALTAGRSDQKSIKVVVHPQT
jgi:L-iditol 2-dehydrogenase